ncbi:MAG: hypothetical protein HXY22_06240 [Alphaproteobacteria bacterium]|nr:hypothetical protein [Alphaproteobacteria bacterium]
MIPIVLDLIVAGLLAGVIAYCLVLDQRLRALREGQTSLTDFIAKLTEATKRAETTLAGIKMVAEGSGAELQQRTKAARAAADELALLVESGSKLSSRLEGQRPENGAGQALLKALKEAR